MVSNGLFIALTVLIVFVQVCCGDHRSATPRRSRGATPPERGYKGFNMFQLLNGVADSCFRFAGAAVLVLVQPALDRRADIMPVHVMPRMPGMTSFV